MPQHADNARLFIWFRVFFNCRFYYPVFTVLFLDLGLSLGEFAALNVVWALTSVILEVPSGALADRFGRRPLVIAAAVLMLLEMTVLMLMPAGRHDLIWWLFVLNRILSGAAEACASGADEALAYDSLPEAERESRWPSIMSHLSRAMALGFVVSSITGSVLYDHIHLSAWIGHAVPKELSMKLPVLLCLCSAIACLITSLRMSEHWIVPAKAPLMASIRQTWGSIWQAGSWVWRTQTVFALILIGIVFDSIIRLFLTVTSNFYRLVGIEEYWFGIISTAVSLLGLLSASWMEKSTRSFSMRTNFTALALVVLGGLFAVAHPSQGWLGVLFAVPLLMSIRFLHFFLSHYLNAAVDSARRATVLSFRGLAINLAYGGLTLLFGWHIGHLAREKNLHADDLAVFSASLRFWPWWFAGTLAAALAFLWLKPKKGLNTPPAP
ncbi:MAG: MFS transporter [Verrucomicrobiaceae bacterium]|nr:MFS transporter [Verrucomicrobiaceae bacterium]